MLESFLSPLTKGIFRINLHVSSRVMVYYSVCHILWAASQGFQGKTGREFLCDVAPNGSVVSAGIVREDPRAALGLGHAVLIRQHFHLVLRFCGHDFYM